MLKAKIFSTTTINALTSTNIYIYHSQPSIFFKNHYFFLFLSLLVNLCILMYLETTILCIYNFLILYGCLFRVFLFSFFFSFLYTPVTASLKSWIRPCVEGENGNVVRRSGPCLQQKTQSDYILLYWIVCYNKLINIWYI